MLSLLVLLLICHFIGDFSHMSTPWMLSAKRFGTPVFPIFVHGLVHAWLMFGVVWSFAGLEKTGMAFFIELVTHTLIDIYIVYHLRECTAQL